MNNHSLFIFSLLVMVTPMIIVIFTTRGYWNPEYFRTLSSAKFRIYSAVRAEHQRILKLNEDRDVGMAVLDPDTGSEIENSIILKEGCLAFAL